MLNMASLSVNSLLVNIPLHETVDTWIKNTFGIPKLYLKEYLTMIFVIQCTWRPKNHFQHLTKKLHSSEWSF